jgi:tetratricopeptide (TPR) repeat protein
MAGIALTLSLLSYNRALSYSKFGKPAEAKADFDKAKQLGYTGPEFTPTRTATIGETSAVDAYNRGVGSLTRNNTTRRLVDFSEALRLKPRDDWAYHMCGRAYSLQGRKTEAQADFDKPKQLGYTGPR